MKDYLNDEWPFINTNEKKTVVVFLFKKIKIKTIYSMSYHVQQNMSHVFRSKKVTLLRRFKIYIKDRNSKNLSKLQLVILQLNLNLVIW